MDRGIGDEIETAMSRRSTKLLLRDLLEDGVHRLVLAGELDILTAPELEDAVRGICAAGPTEILLDLREVTFMDSSGLRATLSAHKLSTRQGCGFSIIPGPRQVHSLFALTGLAERLPFQAGGEEAPPQKGGILPKLFSPSEGRKRP